MDTFHSLAAILHNLATISTKTDFKSLTWKKGIILLKQKEGRNHNNVYISMSIMRSSSGSNYYAHSAPLFFCLNFLNIFNLPVFKYYIAVLGVQ